MTIEPPRRGEIWWVAFDPSVGTEIQKTRPAVVISNDRSNRILSRVQVVPLTSRVDKIYYGQAYVTVRGQRQRAMADQLGTVSKLRLGQRLTRLSEEDILAVEAAVRRQLSL